MFTIRDQINETKETNKHIILIKCRVKNVLNKYNLIVTQNHFF